MKRIALIIQNIKIITEIFVVLFVLDFFWEMIIKNKQTIDVSHFVWVFNYFIIFGLITILIFNLPIIYNEMYEDNKYDYPNLLKEINLFYFFKYKIWINKINYNVHSMTINFIYKNKNYQALVLLNDSSNFNHNEIKKIYDRLISKIIETDAAKVIKDLL